jgi:purine operon repressor
MKRSARIAYIIKELISEPNKVFPLSHFCNKLGAAKSTISEDITIIKSSIQDAKMGKIITIPGKSGGVKLIPHITKEKCHEILLSLCDNMDNAERFLGAGFIYTSDLAFDPNRSRDLATIFAQIYENSGANYVVTIETKGVPLALMTAHQLNIPTVVVRRDPKISEGPTISINYFSGSSGKMKKMSVSKKSLVPGSKAIIIDDFMRAGGSSKGICELLSEMDVEVVGIGVAIATTEPKEKKVSGYTPLVYLNEIDEKNKKAIVKPNENVLSYFTD